jgi:DNA-binding IclR family transcriptional regulator
VDATQALPLAPVIESPAAAGAHRDANWIHSVDRAAALLIALGNLDGEVGVTEIARLLEMHKSTASRLLATLLLRGLVAQDHASGKYRPGPALLRLGDQAERAIDLRAVAMPELESMARFLKETASLGVLDGDTVNTIARSAVPGSSQGRKWERLPLHATAPGKVLLSHGPERELIRLSKIGLTPFTPHTIVRVDLLLDEIARVRKRGYATAFGEYEPAINAVAVPVFNRRGSVVAAVEVRAPGNRISPSRVPELIETIRAAAAAITAQIGGVAVAN